MHNKFDFQSRVIGHRGACAYAPENTLASFTKAVQLGMNWIEFDVMQSSDGEVIIFHDETLERTTNGKGEVHLYPYSYLRTLDAGSWFDLRFSGERIPTLRQLLEFVQNTKISINIELKAFPGMEEPLAKGVAEELARINLPKETSILFSSFSIEALQHLLCYAPNANIGILLHEWHPNWRQLCSWVNCVSVNTNHEIMTQDIAREIKESNKTLLCYTVNNPVRAAELYSWGVDAVFSDAPDLM